MTQPMPASPEEARWPKYAHEWDQKHGIYHYEHNGMVYEYCPDWARTSRMMDLDIKMRAALDGAVAHYAEDDLEGSGGA